MRKASLIRLIVPTAIILCLALSAGVMAQEAEWPGNRQSTFSVYDPATNTWQYAAYDGTGTLAGYDVNMDGLVTVDEGTGRVLGQIAAYDRDGDGVDEIYVFGGYPIWDRQPRIYNPATNTWTVGAPAAFWQSWGAVANGPTVQVGHQVYQYGAGYVPPGQFGVYDIVNDEWTELAWGPDDATGGAAAYFDGKIYIIGGEQAPMVSVYDIASNTWSTNAPMMPLAIANAQAVTYNGKVYLFGGRNLDTNEIIGHILVFDPAAGTWTVFENVLPYEGVVGAAAVELDGYVYLIGGNAVIDGQTQLVRKVFRASMASVEGGAPAWVERLEDPAYFAYHDAPKSRMTTPHFPRAYAAAVAANGKIYVVGGNSVSQFGVPYE